MNTHLTLMMELVLQCHVFFISDRLVVLCDETAQNMEFILELAILCSLHFSFLGEMIALNLQIFDFSEQIIDAASSFERIRGDRSAVRNWRRNECTRFVRYFYLGRREASFTWAR